MGSWFRYDPKLVGKHRCSQRLSIRWPCRTLRSRVRRTPRWDLGCHTPTRRYTERLGPRQERVPGYQALSPSPREIREIQLLWLAHDGSTFWAVASRPVTPLTQEAAWDRWAIASVPSACSHRYPRFSFLIASHTPPGKSIWSECPCRPAYDPLYVVAIRRYRCILASFSAHIGLDHDDLASRIGRKSLHRSVG